MEHDGLDLGPFSNLTSLKNSNKNIYIKISKYKLTLSNKIEHNQFRGRRC